MKATPLFRFVHTTRRRLQRTIESGRYLCLLFAFIPSCNSTAPLHAQIVQYNSGDPLRFGIGYNTLTGSYAGNCMNTVKQEDIKPAGSADLTPGQMTKWELFSTQDMTALSDKLDLSASASASFIAGSASASAKYIRSKSFNSYHEFLYLNASVANATQVWTVPTLTAPMLALRKRNPTDFLNRCGDAFVQTITSGGEMTAILDLSTSASEDTSSLDVAVSGNYGSVQGRAEMKQQLESKISSRQTKVTVIRNGGSGTLPAYSASELIAASLDFPNQILQDPAPMIAVVSSYDHVAPPIDLTYVQESYIQPLFRLYRRAMQYSGDLAYMKGHSSEFRTLSAPPAIQAAADAKLLQETKASIAAFLGHTQSVFSTDFVFNDLDRAEVDDLANKYDTYSDTLGRLAKNCLTSPKTGCKDEPPPFPGKIDDVVRTFTQQTDWNTAVGPVSIVLDSAYVCKVSSVANSWRIADGVNAPVLTCDSTMPKTVTNGNIVTGAFDSYYPDNHGICSYTFLCFRR